MVEACLLFAQSMCSFGCDVFSFGRSSVWKPIDRLCASAFVTWQFTKVVAVCCLLLPFSATPQASFTLTTHYLPSCLQLFWLDMALLEWVIWCTSLLIGITCFKRSIFSLKSAIAASAKDDSLALDLSWYFWWHTLWHVSLPIGAALWSFARHSRLFPGAVAGVWIGTG
jgi:hypothetical protein